MNQPTTLPIGTWEPLFQNALTLVDEIRKHGGTEPFFTFGGGTVLMLRHNHRLSKDIDIFVPDPQSLGFVTPRLSEVAESLCNSQYVEAAGYVKLQMQDGEIDFVAAPNLLPSSLAFERWELFGHSVRVETSAEIVAKKMFHRGDKGTARDLFDLALVIEREPDAMEHASPFLHRHMDKFAEHLLKPSAGFVRQFNDIATIDYQPTFEHAKGVAIDYFEQMKTALAKSADNAVEFAKNHGYEIETVDVRKGNYIGELLHADANHIIQHLGRDRVAIHEVYRLPDTSKLNVEDGSFHLRYNNGMGSVLKRSRSLGIER